MGKHGESSGNTFLGKHCGEPRGLNLSKGASIQVFFKLSTADFLDICYFIAVGWKTKKWSNFINFGKELRRSLSFARVVVHDCKLGQKSITWCLQMIFRWNAYNTSGGCDMTFSCSRFNQSRFFGSSNAHNGRNNNEKHDNCIAVTKHRRSDNTSCIIFLIIIPRGPWELPFMTCVII